MTAEMVAAVVAFVHVAWPQQVEGDPPRRGWEHMSSTSYQIACMALVALGQAEQTAWGAVAKGDPRLPDALPHREDIAVAVLWLAEQQNLLTYQQMDGSLPPPRLGASWCGGSVVRPCRRRTSLQCRGRGLRGWRNWLCPRWRRWS